MVTFNRGGGRVSKCLVLVTVHISLFLAKIVNQMPQLRECGNVFECFCRCLHAKTDICILVEDEYLIQRANVLSKR